MFIYLTSVVQKNVVTCVLLETPKSLRESNAVLPLSQKFKKMLLMEKFDLNIQPETSFFCRKQPFSKTI